MKRLLILTVGICLLLTSVPLMADQAADEAAVRDAARKLADTWNAKDVEGHMSMVAESFVPWDGGEIGTEGYEQDLKDSNNVQYSYEEIGIVFVTPDVAVFREEGGFSGRVDSDGKPLPTQKGIANRLLVRKDGKWKLASFFWGTIEE